MRSWLDTATLASRRLLQEIRAAEKLSAQDVIPTVRVDVGQTRSFTSTTRPIGTRLVVRALRRDTVEVPSGRYPTVVVRPASGVSISRGPTARYEVTLAVRFSHRSHATSSMVRR